MFTAGGLLTSRSLPWLQWMNGIATFNIPLEELIPHHSVCQHQRTKQGIQIGCYPHNPTHALTYGIVRMHIINITNKCVRTQKFVNLLLGLRGSMVTRGMDREDQCSLLSAKMHL